MKMTNVAQLSGIRKTLHRNPNGVRTEKIPERVAVLREKGLAITRYVRKYWRVSEAVNEKILILIQSENLIKFI